MMRLCCRTIYRRIAQTKQPINDLLKEVVSRPRVCLSRLGFMGQKAEADQECWRQGYQGSYWQYKSDIQIISLFLECLVITAKAGKL
jgi:hypothetical protein